MVDSFSINEKQCEEIPSELDLSSQPDPESIIDRFLDVINIKKLLKIFFSKTPFKVTNSFISGFILLIFLIWLYINEDFLSRIIVLVVLIVFLILELLGKNVDFIRKFLFNEDNNKAFLDNMNKYSFDEIGQQTRLRKFTSSNVNHYLNKIKKDPNSEYGFVLENILSHSDLTIENFNILFSEEFLKLNFLRDEIVIRLLMIYKDKLSQKNLLNIYNHFKTNEKIVRYIFATQIQSEFLINENNQLKNYSERFQSTKSSAFYELRENLPNLSKEILNLASNLVTIGLILWVLLSMSILFIINIFQKNLMLSNGYINPSYSSTFFLISIIVLIYVGSMMYILWKILSEKKIEKWKKFKSFVDTD